MTDGTDVQAASEAAPAESDTTAATTETAATETTTEATGDDTEADDPAKDDPAKDDDDDEDEDKPRRASRSERQKRALAATRARNAELEARLAEIEQGKSQPAKDDRPKEQDFNGDYAAFERAQTAYEIKQAIREEKASDERAKANERRTAEQAERLEAYDDSEERVRERLPDYDKVMKAALKDGVKFNASVGELIHGSKEPAHLAYFLAGKPEKTRELNAMSPLQAAREIGRIEASLSLPTANKSTKAPPPRTAPAGGAAAAPDLAKMSMDDYRAYREKGGK